METRLPEEDCSGTQAWQPKTKSARLAQQMYDLAVSSSKLEEPDPYTRDFDENLLLPTPEEQVPPRTELENEFAAVSLLLDNTFELRFVTRPSTASLKALRNLFLVLDADRLKHEQTRGRGRRYGLVNVVYAADARRERHHLCDGLDLFRRQVRRRWP